MFTLCMPRPDDDQRTIARNIHEKLAKKHVKSGYLLRYRRGIFYNKWCIEWVVLYEDSTLAWYSEKGYSKPRGFVRISEAPEFLAYGEWTSQVPKRPRFPRTCHVGQLLAIGSRAFQEVHWLIGPSPAEINDWMTAISNTLPPPPHLPSNNRRPSLNLHEQMKRKNNQRNPNQNDALSNGNIQYSSEEKGRKFENDHTVLSAVCIGWGHGWGWYQPAYAAESTCFYEPQCYHDASFTASSIFCDSAEDTLGGYDATDWSAFGDFGF